MNDIKKMNKQAISRRYEWRERLVSDEESRGHGAETSVIQVQPKYAGNTSVQRCSRKKVTWDAPLVHYWRVRTSSSGSEEMKLRWPCDHHDYTTRKRILCQNVIADRGSTSLFFHWCAVVWLNLFSLHLPVSHIHPKVTVYCSKKKLLLCRYFLLACELAVPRQGQFRNASD